MSFKSSAAWKEEGNQAFKRKDFNEAVRCYEEALARCSTDKEESVLHSNMAAVRLQENDPYKALLSCNESLGKEKNAKAYYRKGQAFLALAKNLVYCIECPPVPLLVRFIEEHTDMKAVNEFELLICAQACFKLSRALSDTDSGTTKVINEVRSGIFRGASRNGVEIAYTKTHSLGMLAVRNIEQGETVLVDRPVAFTRKLQWQEAAKDIVQQCLKLEGRDRDWVASLYDRSKDSRPGEERYYCIWDSNGHSVGEIDFRVADKGKIGSALFLAGSRINHSCVPNAVQVFCHQTGSIRITALRTIKEGDEVTITYCPLHLNKRSRHEKLRFTCACERCSAEEEMPESEDRSEIMKRYEAIAEMSDDQSDPNIRDKAAALAAQLQEDAVRVLGADDEASFIATLLRTKLWAERPGALASLQKLHSFVLRHMPPNWPLLISTNMYLAIHKSYDSTYSDEEVLKHINSAFKIHAVTLGESFDGSQDKIAHFFSRYETELAKLDIDSLERANILFAQC
eukprot:TRINITY_DN2277_c0_g1_i1.p1 TRINITY_DN2277_c0_g1~~TRINITY_DN2277_c0_g1_i1.p1  ORF type:complete len:513 (+),score=164.52 TRINITY_DN2277_c0_g1_i1:459-1997(+)